MRAARRDAAAHAGCRQASRRREQEDKRGGRGLGDFSGRAGATAVGEIGYGGAAPRRRDGRTWQARGGAWLGDLRGRGGRRAVAGLTAAGGGARFERLVKRKHKGGECARRHEGGEWLLLGLSTARTGLGYESIARAGPYRVPPFLLLFFKSQKSTKSLNATYAYYTTKNIFLLL